MPQQMQLKVLRSDAEKVVTISDGGLFLDVSSIQMFDANGAPVVDSGAVVTVGVSADGLSYQSKVASSNASLGGFEFKHIRVSVSGRTTASTVVVDVKVCSISEAMTSDSYKSRLAGLFTATPYTASTLPDPAKLWTGVPVSVQDLNGNVFTLSKKDGRMSPGRYTNKLAFIPSVFGSAGGAGMYGTVHQVFPIPYDFDGIALVLSNLSATPLSLVASVAVSESLAASSIIPRIGGVDYNAKAAAGTQLGWVDTTASGSTAITVPANTELFITDYMPVKSVDRTDVIGGDRLAMGRLYYSNQQPSALYFDTTAEANKFSTDYFGGEYKQFLQYGTNGVGTPSNFTSTTPVNEMHIKGVMLVSRARGVANFLSFGDSIDCAMGIGGDSTKNRAPDVAGWLLPEVKNLASNSRPIGYCKAGWPGRNSANFFAAAQSYVGAVKPTVCIFPAFTPNETLTSQTAISAALNRCKEFVDYCVSNMIVPVVRIPAPCGSPGYTESIRLDIVARVRAWGVLVLDFNTPLYDATAVADAFWKTGAYAVDASPAVKTHPSGLGYSLYRPYVADIVKVLSS